MQPSSTSPYTAERHSPLLPVAWGRRFGAGAAGGVQCRERAVNRGTTPTLPEVAGVIAAWVPHSVRDTDPAALAAVMPVVRSLVAAVSPTTPMAARRLLWAAAPFSVWAHETVGSVGPEDINPRNVEVWVTVINRRRPPGWRNAARAALRRVGRSVNPHGWPELPDEVGRPPACSALHPVEEAAFIWSVGLPDADEPVLRLAVGGFSCGAGMRGPEIVAAQIGDLKPVGSERLAVQVRGRDARLVPIRECWTDVVRRAVKLVGERSTPCDRFIISTDRNAAARAANSISIGSIRLSLRRARATWLTAHIVAGTPLPVLRQIAGPVSAATLNDLLAASGHTVSAEQAVTEGLRA